MIDCKRERCEAPLHTFVLVCVGMRGVDTSPRPPVIANKVMSLYSSIPEKISRSCSLSLCLFLDEAVGVLIVFPRLFNVHCHWCQMSNLRHIDQKSLSLKTACS